HPDPAPCLVLDAAQWETLLVHLGQGYDVPLSEGAWQRLAERMRAGFAQSFYEVLKQDFAQSGKAYPGMVLLLLGEVAAGSRETLENTRLLPEMAERQRRIEAMTQVGAAALGDLQAAVQRLESDQWQRLAPLLGQLRRGD